MMWLLKKFSQFIDFVCSTLTTEEPEEKIMFDPETGDAFIVTEDGQKKPLS